MAIATEAGHWYATDGAPMYEVPNASKGGMRGTTLRDAKKFGLVPSVSEILKVPAKPGLVRYFIDQAYLAMATLPAIEGESVDDRIARARIDADQHAKDARDRGTFLHGILERHFKGDLPKALSDEHGPMIAAVRKELDSRCGPQEWIAEASFAHPLGYGGKCDLYCPTAVVDFKVKAFTGKLEWPEMAMQLDAYRNGLGIPKAKMINVFIDRNNPENVRSHLWDDGDWFERFQLLLEYWKLDRGYRSDFGNAGNKPCA